MDSFSVTLASAYLLDLAIGDPRWLPHPVRGMGWAIDRGERWVRARLQDEKLAGGILVALIAGGTWLAAKGLLWAAGRISDWAVPLTEMALLYVCLSTRDLAVESWPVYRALKGNNLPEARRKVSLIVGRDTENLNEKEVVRAAVETIGESAMDGIVAPLFYAAIGGAPLACLYKAVNTLDSMVGYRSARYLRFGSVAAAVDRAMNWIPARLTAFFLSMAAQILHRSGGRSLLAMRRDGLPTRENSFIAEAAIAGALGIQLGGTNYYQGKPTEAPPLGDPLRELRPERISESIRLMYLCSILAALCAVAVRIFLR